MNKMKKFASIATAVLMTACMAAPMTMSLTSSAADITISQPDGAENVTHTYEAYQIFKGTVSNGNKLSNILWGANIDATSTVNFGTADNPDKKNIYQALATITIDSSNPFTDANGDSLTTAEAVAGVLKGQQDNSKIAKEFAAMVGKFVIIPKDENDNPINPPISDTNGKINNLSDGYYLVQDKSGSPSGMGTTNSDAKTRYILKVAGENVTVTAKSSAPTVMKKVKENTKSVTTTGAEFAGRENYDVGTGYNDVADYCIGDSVPFKLYGTLPSTYADYEHYYYKFTDTLDAQFDAPEKVIIKVNGNAITKPTKSDIFTKITSGTGGTTIEITFEDIKEIAPNATDIITVEYEAVLNENAVIGLDGQENKVDLTYSNNPNVVYTPTGGSGDTTPGKPDEGEADTPETPDDSGKPGDNTGKTPEDKVIVFTYELDVDKVNSEITDATTKAEFDAAKLAGAEFILYKSVTTDNPAFDAEAEESDDNPKTITSLYAAKVENGRVSGWVKGTFNSEKTAFTSAAGETGTATVLSSGGDTYSTIKIAGLDDGTYYLQETKAPTGYNKINDPTTLVISATTANNQSWTGTPADALTVLKLNGVNSLAVDETLGRNGSPDVDNDGINNGLVWTGIVNKEGSELPSTGGIGTTLFYVGGGAMVAVAGVFLITKKRMGRKED